MGFFGKIFKSKSVVTVVAIAVCLIVLFFAYRYRVNNAINAISVPIASKRLDSRDEITKDSIRTVKVAASMITSNVVVNQNDLIGKFVNYNTFVPEGGLFYKSAVVTWDQMPDSAWADIEEGYTIVSLAVNATSTFGNSIYPGDKIDLYYRGYVSTSNESNLFIGKLIEGIEVLAVKDEDGNHIFKKSAEQKNAAALIFAVPEEYHLLLRKAMNATSSDQGLFPVPRNANYNAETTVSSNYIRNYINSQYVTINDDFVSNNTNNSNITVTE